LDAERKITRLQEEHKDLIRELRLKDEMMQESAVKIELMEKKMEAVKKQVKYSNVWLFCSHEFLIL
jgi:dynactin 1